MGDYTKLIVNASLKGLKEAELAEELERLELSDSHYHCPGMVTHIEIENDGQINLILVGQTKYGSRQEEFLQWLEDYVVQGNGRHYVWALQFNEYEDAPVMWRIERKEDEVV